MATKNLTLLLFLFAFLFGCNDDVSVLKDDVPVSNESEGENILEDHIINPEDVKRKNYASARVNVSGGHLTFAVDSPVDAAGNVIINQSGTTQINFRVIIVRNSTSSNVHLQFQIKNSIQSVFWTSDVIRTLDFPNNQLEKTVTGSFNITAAGVNQGNYDLCLFVRDFIAGQDFTGDCKNTITFVPPTNIAITPNGGTYYEEEQTQVTWRHDLIPYASSVKIEVVSGANLVYFKTLTYSTPNDGVYQHDDYPASMHGDGYVYKIKITPLGGGYPSYFSDNFFQVVRH